MDVVRATDMKYDRLQHSLVHRGLIFRSVPSSKWRNKGWTRTIKESSGDRDYFMAVTDGLKNTGAVVLQGNEPDIAWGLSSGARGLVPVCANYAPRLFAEALESE